MFSILNNFSSKKVSAKIRLGMVAAGFSAAGFSIALCGAVMGAASIAVAHDYTQGALTVDHPWAAPTAGAGLPGAVYFKLINQGDVDDRLLAVKSERAQFVELHLTARDEKGVASMRVAKDGLVIKANDTAEAAPGGHHVMLIGLETPLAEGESFPLELVFEKAGPVAVTVKVETPKDTDGAQDHSAHKGHHGHKNHDGHKADKDHKKEDHKAHKQDHKADQDAHHGHH